MRRPVIAALATAVAASLAAVPASVSAAPASAVPASAAPARKIDLARWDGAAEWRTGVLEGTRVTNGGRLAYATRLGGRKYDGRKYDGARWTGPWVSPGFSFTDLVASWEARTPGDSWIEVRVRGRSAGGSVSSWDTLARWTSGDRRVQRRSVSGQTDDGTRVDVDTWRTAGLASYQLAVAVYRRKGTTAVPSLDTATAMTSRLPATAGKTSAPGVARGITLKVPRYSQMAHTGHYPRWGGGGEAWCSPTSTSMVLGYYGRLPSPKSYSWVPDGHVDPWVDHAARMTYDHAYDGTGNWPFNTAYAAPHAGKGFVTRLRDLRDAEQLVKAGIPPVVSVAFGRGELDNAPISATNGHLLVIVGFRTDGSVVVNDPASKTRKGVRRTYRRDQLERAWLEGSGGLTYVVHNKAHPLPPSTGSW